MLLLIDLLTLLTFSFFILDLLNNFLPTNKIVYQFDKLYQYYHSWMVIWSVLKKLGSCSSISGCVTLAFVIRISSKETCCSHYNEPSPSIYASTFLLFWGITVFTLQPFFIFHKLFSIMHHNTFSFHTCKLKELLLSR